MKIRDLTGSLGSLLRGRALRILASLALSVTMLWLAGRAIEGHELAQQLERAHFGWVAVAIALYWIELVIRGLRWRLILAPVKLLRFTEVWGALLVGYAANNVLPARLGELFRADYLGRTFGVSRLSVIGTIVVERVQDMIAVTLCAALGVAYVLAVNASSAAVLGGAVTLSGVLVIVAVLSAYLITAVPSLSWVRRFPRVHARVSAIAEGFRTIRRMRTLALSLALSALIWFLNGWGVWAILNAFGIAPDLGTIVLLIGVAGIAAAIPSAPASLGTLQFAFVTGLVAIGLPGTTGFAAALLIQVFLLGSVTLVGAVVYVVSTARRVAPAVRSHG